MIGKKKKRGHENEHTRISNGAMNNIVSRKKKLDHPWCHVSSCSCYTNSSFLSHQNTHKQTNTGYYVSGTINVVQIRKVSLRLDEDVWFRNEIYRMLKKESRIIILLSDSGLVSRGSIKNWQFVNFVTKNTPVFKRWVKYIFFI